MDGTWKLKVAQIICCFWTDPTCPPSRVVVKPPASGRSQYPFPTGLGTVSTTQDLRPWHPLVVSWVCNRVEYYKAARFPGGVQPEGSGSLEGALGAQGLGLPIGGEKSPEPGNFRLN